MFGIGQSLYLKRLEKGMTQMELVQRTGIPQPNVSKIERGKQDLTVSTLLKICSALETHPSKLFAREVKPLPKRKTLFNRSFVEKIAKAVVHGKAGLSSRGRKIARWVRKVLPQSVKARAKQKDLHQAWMALKHELCDEEIKILFERIEDEKGRSA